jgi:flagellar basal-body rod protein FlgF
MDNSIYIVLSRQTALFRDLDVTSNNVANTTTTGFKGEKVLFTDYLLDDGNRNKMAFTNDISSLRDTDQGRLQVTENPFDMAISGKGYFVVETPLGNRYTRAGNFQLDAEGTLVTPDGYPVLDDAGQRIILDPESREIVVRQDGVIQVDGEELAVIGVAEFENEQVMERLSSALYKSDVAPQAPTESKVLHGVLEQSNVQPVSEIVHLVDLGRSVASLTRFIDSQYDLQRRASSILARQGSS